MRDAFPIVCKLGDRLVQERTGWRDTKALIVLVAQAGDWNGASCLADALGVHPDMQRDIYREVYGSDTHITTVTITMTGGATPAPPTRSTA